ncbi:MAG TPA: PRC-barrel domain-containing protein [Thermoplasmataceae archaeon]|nr:PRC-barrel domain-containing protein [Thermoplasmatales archaeon AK]HLH86774.1 PRC-barrel domain-containing protein [Thermoplasmataceae archaeon]
MPVRKFASDILKRSVVSQDGEQLGTIVNLAIDPDAGTVGSALVKISGNIRLQDYTTDKEGRYMIPLSDLKPFRDVFVLEKYRKSELQQRL